MGIIGVLGLFMKKSRVADLKPWIDHIFYIELAYKKAVFVF